MTILIMGPLASSTNTLWYSGMSQVWTQDQGLVEAGGILSETSGAELADLVMASRSTGRPSLAKTMHTISLQIRECMNE